MASTDTAGRTHSLAISGMAMMTPSGVGRKLADMAAPGTTSATAAPGIVSDLECPDEVPPTGPGRLADRPSAMAIETIGALLPGSGYTECPPDRRGVVLGSSSVSMDQSMTVTRDSLTHKRPYNVNPALIPACVMNYASARSAIEYESQGPNVTVTAGRTAGLAAFTYARRLLRRDRADAVVCGAFEDLNDRRASIAALAREDTGGAHQGEGACVFLVESPARSRARGAPRLADVLAVDSAVATVPHDSDIALADLARRVLRRCEIAPADVGLCVVASDEDSAVRDVVEHAAVVRPAEIVGDTLGATAAFQIATATLAHAAHATSFSLIATKDQDGQLSCAVLATPN